MSDPLSPLQHANAESKSDGVLAQEAEALLRQSPRLQLMAELLKELRRLELPWWSPESLRAKWNASVRLGWFRQRPDLRQRITTALTGLAAKTARNKTPEFQATLIDSVLDEGDIAAASFEAAFAPEDLAVYGPVDEYWREFRSRMPWHEPTPEHQELWAWLIATLQIERTSAEGFPAQPVLTAWDIRAAIDLSVWHTHLPLRIRIAIDEARLEHEQTRRGEPFLAEHELMIATPHVIARSLPLGELRRILDTAEAVMGFDREKGAQRRAGKGSRPPATSAIRSGTLPMGSTIWDASAEGPPTDSMRNGSSPSSSLASSEPARESRAPTATIPSPAPVAQETRPSSDVPTSVARSAFKRHSAAQPILFDDLGLDEEELDKLDRRNASYEAPEKKASASKR